jgi:diaminohydroxyphosphoribosylaminopyrimidine deaminase/5-amino-6-(5-phosphoribosylamino)uracil reductase
VHDNAPGTDERMMARALELAARGSGWVSPNPKVGAVIARGDAVIAEGWHARYGDEHAEAMALRLAGTRAAGATAYVTLEPCDHRGKTPPCSRALIAAGVVRVVYAVDDPNPVAAGGAARLRDAGIEVIAGVLRDDAAELNAPFLFAASGATRPFVTLKLALSIDGAIVDASRRRAWLTGPESRRLVHAMRADADAVAVGIETALADDPELTVREIPAPRIAPTRVVFDRRARLPLDSALVRSAGSVPVVVVTDGSRPASEDALRACGVGVLPAADLREALARLRADGVRHLLVEGGAGLASAIVAGGLADRLITFQAPVILGAGALPAFAALIPDAGANAGSAGGPMRLDVLSRRELGPDLMTRYRFSHGFDGSRAVSHADGRANSETGDKDVHRARR